MLVETTISDHAPVILELRAFIKIERSTLRVPESMLVSPIFKSEVEHIWHSRMYLEGPVVQKVLLALDDISKFFYTQARLQSEVHATKERNLRRALKSLQRLQEKHPACSWTANHLTEAKQFLIEIEEKREEFSFHKNAAHLDV